MYRRHSQSDHIQTALFQRRIKYGVVGRAAAMDRKEVRPEMYSLV